jgi:DNA-binding XRE family transcriptional regulator
MTAQELKEARQKLGLSLKDAARIFETPERTWRAWETEAGQNARRVPGCIGVGLSFYADLPKGKKPL